MKNLQHLPYEDRKHYMLCPSCREYFDVRKLNEVMYHGLNQCKKDHTHLLTGNVFQIMHSSAFNENFDIYLN